MPLLLLEYENKDISRDNKPDRIRGRSNNNKYTRKVLKLPTGLSWNAKLAPIAKFKRPSKALGIACLTISAGAKGNSHDDKCSSSLWGKIDDNNGDMNDEDNNEKRYQQQQKQPLHDTGIITSIESENPRTNKIDKTKMNFCHGDDNESELTCLKEGDVIVKIADIILSNVPVVDVKDLFFKTKRNCGCV